MFTEIGIDYDRRYTMSLRKLNKLCNDSLMYSCIKDKSQLILGSHTHVHALYTCQSEETFIRCNNFAKSHILLFFV